MVNSKVTKEKSRLTLKNFDYKKFLIYYTKNKTQINKLVLSGVLGPTALFTVYKIAYMIGQKHSPKISTTNKVVVQLYTLAKKLENYINPPPKKKTLIEKIIGPRLKKEIDVDDNSNVPGGYY
jgi:urease accessory protein UreE